MRLTRPLLRKLVKKHTLERYKVDIKFNNFWQTNRNRTVRNIGVVERLQERGIHVEDIRQVATATSHLPQVPEHMLSVDPHERDPVIRAPDEDDETLHPFYHERPAYCFGTRSSFPRGRQLEFAKVLFNAVEIEDGLPARVEEAVTEEEAIPGQEEAVASMVREHCMFDSTQRMLPKRVAVPYIGWHPVLDRMYRSMPYEVTMSWQRNERRIYGIPRGRRNFNLVRGLLHHCDYLSTLDADLASRHQLEGCMLQQFFEKSGKLVRFRLEAPFTVTAPAPLAPFANAEEVTAASGIALPSLEPQNEFAGINPKNVYQDESAFPLLPEAAKSHPAPNVVLGVGLDNAQWEWWGHDYFSSRSLAASFLLALGQARLGGLDAAGGRGRLEKPICVQYVFTNGRTYYFSAFQLNTLDLEDAGVKNIFWQREEPVELFEKCEYVQGRPQFSGYNPQVFRRLQAMYRQK